MNKLKQKHNKEKDCKYNINYFENYIIYIYFNFVFKTTIIKKNILNSTVKNLFKYKKKRHIERNKKINIDKK